MITISRMFGFPLPEDRDSVRFHFAKSLSYNVRVNLTVVLLLVGCFLQLLFMNPVHGIPFLLLGIGLVLVKGYDSRARIKSFDLDPNWKTVTMDKIREIEQLRKRSRKWDSDALDISNPLGCFILIFFGGIALAIAFGLGILSSDSRVTIILAADAGIILVPLWFSGTKRILKQPNLAVKVNIIQNLHEEFITLKQEGEEFKPSLLLARGKESEAVPVDARFSIAFPDPPEGFYGLQAQVNLNVVQGTSYPYFYCVLAAKPGFGLLPYKNKRKRNLNSKRIEKNKR